MKAFFLTLLLVLFFLSKLIAQDLNYLDRRFTILPLGANEIELNGRLDEPVWKERNPFRYIEFRPDWGQEDNLTQMWVTFDDRYLYVAARCLYPDVDKIVNRNLVRDDWKGDDWFTFHIDSYGDQQNALVFSMYPSGSRYDMAISNDGIELGNSTFNRTYDMIWEGESNIDELGWSLEMKIPLENLRFQKSDDDGTIRSAISSARTINDKNELYVFPAIPQEVDGDIMRPSIKQPVEFKTLNPRKQFLITPYALGGVERSSELNSSGESYEKIYDHEGEVGLDIRYGLSPKMTLDLTYNTDFSQVEADDQVVNLGRFSVFFPEKRRFFQEQAGLYEVRLGGASQLFYSRTIGISDGELVPILGGFRLNGKAGAWDIGAMSLQTRSTHLNDHTEVPSENFSVLRLRKKVFNDRSFVGVMGTSRVRDGYQNYAIGADALLNLKRNIYLVGSLAYAHDGKQENHDFLDKSLLYLDLSNRVSQDWIYTLTYNYAAADFLPGMGFLGRPNIHNPFFQLSHGRFRTPEEKGLRYTKWTLLASDQYWSADQADFETWYSFTGWEASNFKGDNYDVSHVRELQVLQDTLHFSDRLYARPDRYFFHYAFLGYYPAAQRKFSHWTRATLGSFYGGQRFSLTYSPKINFGKHLEVSVRWRSNYIDLTNIGSGAEWIHVVRLQLDLALNLHLSASAVVQYNTTNKTYFNNARLRYNFSDGHDLYLVYNETYNDDRKRESPTLPLSQQQTIVLKYLYTLSL